MPDFQLVIRVALALAAFLACVIWIAACAMYVLITSTVDDGDDDDTDFDLLGDASTSGDWATPFPAGPLRDVRTSVHPGDVGRPVTGPVPPLSQRERWHRDAAVGRDQIAPLDRMKQIHQRRLMRDAAARRN